MTLSTLPSMAVVAHAARSAADPLAVAVGAVGRRFVLHWGEMGWRWGVNRTVSQAHALLYLSARPMHAEELAAVLQVARSNISTSLRELANWDLVKVVHLVADRRDHYQAAQDPWELMRVVVRERKEREFDPTLAVLRDCAADPGLGELDSQAQKRLRETLALMELVSDWTEKMLRLEPELLRRLGRVTAELASPRRGSGPRR